MLAREQEVQQCGERELFASLGCGRGILAVRAARVRAPAHSRMARPRAARRRPCRCVSRVRSRAGRRDRRDRRECFADRCRHARHRARAAGRRCRGRQSRVRGARRGGARLEARGIPAQLRRMGEPAHQSRTRYGDTPIIPRPRTRGPTVPSSCSRTAASCANHRAKLDSGGQRDALSANHSPASLVTWYTSVSVSA